MRIDYYNAACTEPAAGIARYAAPRGRPRRRCRSLRGRARACMAWRSRGARRNSLITLKLYTHTEDGGGSGGACVQRTGGGERRSEALAGALTLGADGVNLVDEDDGGRLLLRQLLGRSSWRE